MCDSVPNVKKNELKAWVGKVLNACFFFSNVSKIIFAKPSLQKKIQSCFITIRDCKKRRQKKRKKINSLQEKLYLQDGSLKFQPHKYLHTKKEITKKSCKTKKEQNKTCTHKKQIKKKHRENLNITKEKNDMWKKLLHTIATIVMKNSNDAKEAKM